MTTGFGQDGPQPLARGILFEKLLSRMGGVSHNLLLMLGVNTQQSPSDC